MRKGDTINFRFGGRSTTFCNSGFYAEDDYNHSRDELLQQIEILKHNLSLSLSLLNRL